MATCPATPVAPSTSRVSPGTSLAPKASAFHDDTAGFIIEAAVTSSTSSGIGVHSRCGATAYSAMAP